MPHVLLTNDDGFDREGIGALREALLAADLDVTVLAPSGNRSGASRSITCHGLVDVVEHAGGAAPILHCSGTPVDAVRIGLLSERCAPADVVVSGINHGTNLGDDVHYSGTVAAAVEAALLGVPGIAFSQQADDGGVGLRETGAHGFALAGLAASLVRHVVERPPPPGVALSVNLPARPPAPGAVALVRPGRRTYRRGLARARRVGAGSRAVPALRRHRVTAAARDRAGHGLRGAAGRPGHGDRPARGAVGRAVRRPGVGGRARPGGARALSRRPSCAAPSRPRRRAPRCRILHRTGPPRGLAPQRRAARTGGSLAADVSACGVAVSGMDGSKREERQRWL